MRTSSPSTQLTKAIKTFLLGTALLYPLPAYSAPLFPDVGQDKQAHSALKSLATKGIIEGYPDGTFKGDRSMSRWEVAVIVAASLKRSDEQSAFATRAERVELLCLAESVKEELGALGLRVEDIQDSMERLESRVTELERIQFYGELETRVTFQSFRNGSDSLNSMRSLNPGIAFDNINYNAIVGTAAGAGGVINVPPFTGAPPPGGIFPPGQGTIIPLINPYTAGISRVRNWTNGRPLTSGTGFTARALLGLDITVTDDISAGAEFSAYSSQGDALVDAYYGVQQPYLSNPTTAGTINTGGTFFGPNPTTRMTLDKFWVDHEPSGTKLILGSYDEFEFNDSIYKGLWNPNEFGAAYLENYGFLLSGSSYTNPDETQEIEWQLMGTLLPDGSPGPFTPGTPGEGTNYFSHVFGAKLAYKFHEERGRVRLNFLRAADEARNGNALNTGLLQVPNFRAHMQWVNPNGFFINQLQNPSQQASGMGSTGDIRPIPTNPLFGADGSLAERVRAGLLPQGVPNIGGIGPQQQTSWGLALDYEFDHKWSPRVFGEYARSSYRPNKNSSYSANGSAWNLGGSLRLLEGDLDLEAEYLSVDPRFSPFIIQMPTVARVSFMPGVEYHQNLFALHDVKRLPHNREGFRGEVSWRFLPTGRVTLSYEDLDQKVSSVQDVRFSAGSLGLATPNTPVLGYSPGWIEPIFGPYHQATFAPSGNNGLALARENEKGRLKKIALKGGYKWLFNKDSHSRGLKLTGGVRRVSLDRPSQMQAIGRAQGLAGAGTQAENQNLIDIDLTAWKTDLTYDVTDDFRLSGGFTQVNVKGHIDPFNASGLYAESVGVTNFNNQDFTQSWPEFGFEWDLEEDLTWTARARHYTLKDHVPSHQFVNPSVTTLNIQNGPQTTHPFGWEGFQLTTQMSLKF